MYNHNGTSEMKTFDSVIDKAIRTLSKEINELVTLRNATRQDKYRRAQIQREIDAKVNLRWQLYSKFLRQK